VEWRGQGARWLQVWLPVWRDREATSRFFGFNFIEENLRGLEPDVAILAENSNYNWSEAIKILRPKTVHRHHYDDWRVPLSSGMTLMTKIGSSNHGA
jgi:hypothetical protein